MLILSTSPPSDLLTQGPISSEDEQLYLTDAEIISHSDPEVFLQLLTQEVPGYLKWRH